MRIKIIYGSYWGLSEGLSVSTSQPNLRILAEMEQVERIYYTTVERQSNQNSDPSGFIPPKTDWIPTYASQSGWKIWDRWADVSRIWASLEDLIQKKSPQLVILRGAIMAMFAYWIKKKYPSLYVGIESYEPHADYMLESAVWGKNSLFYRVQKHYEQAAKRVVDKLVTVTENYKQHLSQKEAISSEKIAVSPCWVQLDKFIFGQKERQIYRDKLGIGADMVAAIYVGKFGGIYYDKEAFQWFKKAFDYWGNKLFLILLSPDNKQLIINKLEAENIDISRVFVGLAAHHEIPSYLSAADFAFSPIKEAPVRRFCSPIKDGEYWSCGLPILIPRGVGDDSDIINQEGGGKVVDIQDPEQVQKGFLSITEQLQQPDIRTQCRQIAERHRSDQLQRQVYADILQQLTNLNR